MDPHTTPTGRDACHATRDAFFAACAPLAAPGAPACAELRAAYEAACLPSWRAYWEDRLKRGRPILRLTT